MQSPLALHKRTVRTLTIKSLCAYISFLTNILGLFSKDEYTLSTLLKNEYTLHIAGWIGSLGSFIIYATIFSFSLTTVLWLWLIFFHLPFLVLPISRRKAKNKVPSTDPVVLGLILYINCIINFDLIIICCNIQ